MRASLLSLALLVLACSESSPEPAASGPVVVGDAAVWEASAPVAPSLYASFVSESAPGEAPGMIALENQTPMVMSLWVDQAVFFGVAPTTSTGWDLAASADLLEDITLGRHENDGSCVQFRLKTISGVTSMELGKYYSARIDFDDYNGFSAEVSEAPPAGAYVALRAIVHDPAVGGFAASKVDIEIAGERHAAHFESHDDTPTSWVYAGASGAVLTAVEFTDRGGGVHRASEVAELTQAGAYSVVIDEQPAPGAALSIGLIPSP